MPLLTLGLVQGHRRDTESKGKAEKVIELCVLVVSAKAPIRIISYF